MLFLSSSQIKSHLVHQGLKTSFDIQVFSSINSTNCFLKKPSFKKPLVICCAEQQIRGKGRFGRMWDSPFGEHIYCSSRWQLNKELSAFPGISLICGLAVITTIKEIIHPLSDLKIKWPNDLFWKDKKLCGILIELVTPTEDKHEVIIGIGLNVNPKYPNPEWSSLYDIYPKYYNRNLIIARLIINLEQYLHKLAQNPFDAFRSEWEDCDYLVGKYVTLKQATTQLSGTVRGVDSIGRLILEDDKGNLHHLSSGNTSLHS